MQAFGGSSKGPAELAWPAIFVRIARRYSGFMARSLTRDCGSIEVAGQRVDDFPSNDAFLPESFERDGIRRRKQLSTHAALTAPGRETGGAVISDLGRQAGGMDSPWPRLEFATSARGRGASTHMLMFAGRRGDEKRERLLEAGAMEVTSSAVEVFRCGAPHLGGS
jgi:hypothetical protein